MLHARLGMVAVLGAGLLLAGCGQNAVTGQAAQAPAQAGLPSKTPMQIGPKGLSALAAGDAVALPTLAGKLESLGTRTPNLEIHFMRHIDGFVNTAIFFTTATPIFKADSTWKVVVGLAGGVNNTCFSFESYNYPGEYLRHKNSRVLRTPNDGTPSFNADATWCTRFALDGGTDAGDLSAFSYRSFNFPDRYLRHYNGELWLAQKGGPLPSDNPNLFEQDASWDFYAPLINF